MSEGTGEAAAGGADEAPAPDGAPAAAGSGAPPPAVAPGPAGAGSGATPREGPPPAAAHGAGSPPAAAPEAEGGDAGPFGGALARADDGWREALDPALAAALRAAATGPAAAVPEADQAGAAGPAAVIAPWTVDGGHLRYARAPGRPAVVALRSVAAAARAVAKLHAAGRPHGDLRPETVCEGPEGATALVTPPRGVDAGALLRARLRAGAPPEAVGWVAPEVVRGGPASQAADVYGLAALAFAALSGGDAPLGRAVIPDAPEHGGLSALITRALAATPSRRPPLVTLVDALEAAAARESAMVAAAGAAPPLVAPTDLADGFQLVEPGATSGAAPPRARGRLVGADALPPLAWPPAGGEAPARAEREGAQVSVILALVLGLGVLFVLVGAIGLAVVLGGPGIMGLLALLTVGAYAGGLAAEGRGSPRGGVALVGAASQLLWADAAYLLSTADLLDSAGAWAGIGALIAMATGWLGAQRRSTALFLLAGLGALVACVCLWSAVGPGGRVFLLAAASGGLLAAGWVALSSGSEGPGLLLVHAGALLFLAIAAQLLHVTHRLDEAGPWSLAAGVCALATALLAARLRAPGLWALAAVDACIGLACLWAALGPTGRGLLALACALALVGAGVVAAERGPDAAPLPGLGRGDQEAAAVALPLLGTVAGWVSAWHLLEGADRLDSAGAWAVVGGLLGALATGLAARLRALPLSLAGALYLSVAAGFLGKHLSTGSALGPALYAGTVALAFVGLAAALHRLAGPTLAGSPAAVAVLWAWASVVGGFHALDRGAATFGVAWPLALTVAGAAVALVGPATYRVVGAVAAWPLVALVPTVLAFWHHDSVPMLQLCVGTGLAVIAAAFHAPSLATPARQVLAVLPALVPTTFAPAILCLVKCGGRDGFGLLLEALESLGRVHETRFAYLASVVGTSGAFVALAFLFARRALSRAPYRLLEAAALLQLFGTLTILSLARAEDWFYPALLFGGGAVVIGLGTWQRRALLVAAASLALFLNLWIQYFAKLHDELPAFGLLLGFGCGLLAFGLLYERRVKHVLPALKAWD